MNNLQKQLSEHLHQSLEPGFGIPQSDYEEIAGQAVIFFRHQQQEAREKFTEQKGTPTITESEAIKAMML